MFWFKRKKMRVTAAAALLLTISSTAQSENPVENVLNINTNHRNGRGFLTDMAGLLGDLGTIVDDFQDHAREEVRHHLYSFQHVTCEQAIFPSSFPLWDLQLFVFIIIYNAVKDTQWIKDTIGDQGYNYISLPVDGHCVLLLLHSHVRCMSLTPRKLKCCACASSN